MNSPAAIEGGHKEDAVIEVDSRLLQRQKCLASLAPPIPLPNVAFHLFPCPVPLFTSASPTPLALSYHLRSRSPALTPSICSLWLLSSPPPNYPK